VPVEVAAVDGVAGVVGGEITRNWEPTIQASGTLHENDAIGGVTVVGGIPPCAAEGE
jgi:hypothetical protein